MKNAKRFLGGILAFSMLSTSIGSVAYAETLSRMSKKIINDNYSAQIKTNTNADNIFSVDGQKFIMLDNMSDGSYFVMGYGIYGSHAFDADNTQKYDIADEEGDNLGNYMDLVWEGTTNDAFLKLPESLKSHVIETVWETEAGTTQGNALEQYNFTANIAPISATEYVKYIDKIGTKDEIAKIVVDGKDISTGVWSTRTADTTYGDNDKTYNSIICFPSGAVQAWSANYSFDVRPVMYLNNDFFKDVKIDVYTAGDNVKSVIQSEYQISDLSGAGYTEEELNILFDVQPVVKPVITSVSITGGNLPGDELSSAVEYDSNTVSVKYQWQASADGISYSDITGATSDKFKLTSSQGSKYVRLAATPVNDKGTLGDTVYSDAILVEAALVKQTAANIAALGLKTVTDSKDIFTVDGQKFIMLEAADNNEFFVMGYNSYGSSQFDPDSTQKYNIEDPNNIGYYVSKTVWDGGGTLVLPEKVKNHAMTKTWRTEPGTKYGNAAAEYRFEAPISLISATEFAKYKDIIGIADEMKAWATRTADVTWDASDHKCVICFAQNATTKEWSTGRWALTGAFDIRPVMWLDSDFFKDAKVDVYTVGETVKAAIQSKYTEEELALAGYTTEELDVFYGRETVIKPEINSVVISGNNFPGQELSSEVTYDENTASVNYQWEASADGKTYSAIGGAVSDKFTLTSAQGGKYVRLAAVPVSGLGVAGEAVYSDAMFIETALTKQKADDISALGLKEYTDAADIFTVGDKKFIMLDTNDNDEFFVMAYDGYGKSAFDPDKTSKYDITDTNNIGYYVLNTVWKDLGDKVLPPKVKTHAVEKVWRTEPGNNASNAKTEYIFSAPLALISATEFRNYKDIIGIKDIEVAWTTRTADSTWDGADHTCCILFGKNTSTTAANLTPAGWSACRWLLSGTYETRPVMYLDKGFFLDEVIPADQLGANVIEKMKQVYTVAELKTVYSKQDLNTYFGLSDFAIENAAVTSSAAAEKTVSADIVSNSAESANALFIVAVYDSTGEVLKGIATDSVETAANGRVNKSLTVNVDASADTDIVKVMLWDGWSTLVPLCADVLAE